LGKEVEEAQMEVMNAVSKLDKAADKGVIHRNNAARRKSRLMRSLAEVSKTE
jgi:small subunit ribosomal protein S20